jgi:WD40 repeat protein
MEKTAHSTATSVTSLPADRHVGIVNHIAWASSKSPINKYLTTAGSDGVVKVWDTETCSAVWTSPRSSDSTGYVKAFLDVSSRTLIALTQTGELKAWSPVPIDVNSTGSECEMKTVSAWVPAEESVGHPQTASFTLILERAGPVTTVIVHAKDQMKAWRFVIRFEDQKVLVYSLCGPIGPITALHLDRSNASESSILMVGDSLSQVSIYDLGSEASTHHSADFASATIIQAPRPVDPNIAFSAHDVGAVTTIATNRVLLATGNEFGVINVWNLVTLEAVRTINASDHAKNGIGALTIVLQMDQLVASVGRSVVHWRIGKWETVKQIKSAKQRKVAQKGKRKGIW